MIDLKELVRLGAHFGHIKRRLHPKMSRYIWGLKSNVHLFDVSKTSILIEKAAKFLESVASDGKTILWVGTKKPAQSAILDVAQKVKMPYVNHRWIGGTLSNFSQVKKSVTKLLHYEDIVAKSENFPLYTKKELNSFSKMVDRLEKNIGGIKHLSWPIGAIVLVDVIKERSALREACNVGIPVVAFVDTNSDPSFVDHVIPINDDSARVIKLVIDYLGDATVKGQKAAKDLEKKKKEEAELAKKSKLRADGEKKTSVEKKENKKSEAATKKAPTKKAVAGKSSSKKDELKPVVKLKNEKKVDSEKKKAVASKESPKSKNSDEKVSKEVKRVEPKKKVTSSERKEDKKIESKSA